MDGSAAPFVFLIQSAGIEEQKADKKFLRIKKKVRVKDGDKWAELAPFDGFKATFTIHFDHPIFRRDTQTSTLNFSSTSFLKEVSRARTFGFLSDYEQLRAQNLALGCSLDNVIVIDEYRILNEDGLRYKNEFVKHKILDAIGDMYLLGYNLIGAFTGYKSGHAMNNQLLRTLLENKEAWELVTFKEKSQVPISFVPATATSMA
jgi:UDP-3-O-[3-hydroxymyristoyl] N-acetylglucosamine deacetylase